MSSSFLGQGGFGFVEKVQLDNGLFVARKTLSLTQFEDENASLKRRFKREVEYQASFNHPYIVPILFSELENEPPCFYMPLATCHLGKEAEKGFILDLNSKIFIFLSVLSAIKLIHSQNHIHRDIKPANILRFDAPTQFYYAISDFGLISPSNRGDTTSLTSTNAWIGSEPYMAPECYLHGSKAATNKSDIYSLGVLLLFLFKNDDENLGFPYSERTSKNMWGDLISMCTKQSPDERIASVEELEYEFNSILAKLGK